MWARNYDKCISCGTTELPHTGKGCCKRCYHRINKELRVDQAEINRRIAKRQKERHRSRINIKEQLTSDVLRDLYFLKNMSFGDIAKQYSCSRAYILKLCKLYGISVRNKSKARLLALKTGKLPLCYHRVNERFFNAWSKEMAYILGLLFADGNMPQNKAVFSLSLKDKEFLEQIRDILGSTHPIRKSKVQELYSLIIGSTSMAKDLLGLGFTPKKSLIIKFPTMPDRCISHFIRGYFDGDGSIYKPKRRNGHQVDIVSGSKDFILSLKSKLEKMAIISEQKVHKHNTSNSYYLKYQSKKDIERMFAYFYDDYAIKDKLYLPRKFLKFQEAINSYKNWSPEQTRASQRFDREKTSLRVG